MAAGLVYFAGILSAGKTPRVCAGIFLRALPIPKEFNLSLTSPLESMEIP